MTSFNLFTEDITHDFETSTLPINDVENVTEGYQTIPFATQQGFSPFLVFVRALLAVLAVVGNAVTIITIMRNRQLWKPTYFFICNVCFFDFLYGCFLAPTYLATRKIVITSAAIEIGCTLKGILVGLITTGGTASMLLVAIDRVIYIMVPLRYFSLVTNAFSTLLILGAGLASLAFSTGIYWHNTMTKGFTCLPTVFLRKMESVLAFSYVLFLSIITLILNCIVGAVAYKQGGFFCVELFAKYLFLLDLRFEV